ncbi:MAG: DMT family transporter [Clostridia bacterium]|nr:DMT family transporter [Clostridia bacterium]
MLVLAAMIWGLSFVAQSEGMKHVEGFTFNGIRMLMGAAVLMPIIAFKRIKNPVKTTKAQKKIVFKKYAAAIIPVGLALFIGSNLQQFAFNYTEVGKVGFLTAIYMLLVPIFGLFMKKRPPFTVWIGVILGMGGLYLLCMGSSNTLNLGKGEILTLICAVAFAIHIILIDKFASEIDPVVLSCGQFLITGVLSVICMFIFEEPKISEINAAIVPILYSGIMSSGVAFTLQVIGQKYTEPTIASMLLCLESVFSVIFAFLILGQSMETREYIGCAVMFCAIIIAQIPKKQKQI